MWPMNRQERMSSKIQATSDNSVAERGGNYRLQPDPIHFYFCQTVETEVTIFCTIVVDGEMFPYIPFMSERHSRSRSLKLYRTSKILPLIYSCFLIHIPIIGVNAMVTRDVDLLYNVQKVTPLKVKATEVDRKYLSRHSFCNVML